MKCLAVCQNEFVIRLLAGALSSTQELEFVVEDKLLARRLHDLDVKFHVANPRRVDTYLQAAINPTTCVLIEEAARRSPKRTIEAIRDAGGVLVYLLDVGHSCTAKQRERHHGLDVMRLALADLIRSTLRTELDRSLTRARVEQYQRYLADAERVLILLHNDPDPDAMASGLALRTLLHRTKTTAILGAFQGVTRPENLRMASLLGIHVEQLNRSSLAGFARIATVDVQPHYFGRLINHVDLVIDHHPARAGYSAAFKDIRPDYGSTCTILTEHLRAVDANISERTATAMLYAIKSDTLFLSRHTDEPDLDAFRFLYPLANTALVRKMEGSETTLERLSFLAKAARGGMVTGSLYSTHLGEVPREDVVAFVADFLLQIEEVTWVVVSGIVHGDLVISVRNLGDSRHAGEFVKQSFGDIGNAGGHRAMAKVVAPLARAGQKFGSLDPARLRTAIHATAAAFLDAPPTPARRRGATPATGLQRRA
ncbi:MAG: DHH family phosphoesterase [Acidobacteriota bacterium]|nr:DHH family phosphoesterase [Acidobacteriota bacterium]